jgi:hypothetical protein
MSASLDTIVGEYFPDITDFHDLGFFAWQTQGTSTQHLATVSTNDILERIEYNAVPEPVQSVDELNEKCPFVFQKVNPKKKYKVGDDFPSQPSYMVPLHVAVAHRHIDPQEIQFIFGGSVLHVLMDQKIQNEKEYHVQQIPDTNIIVVQKTSSYFTNPTEPGFQFERFVLGRQTNHHHQNAEESLLSSASNNMPIDHLQMVTIHGSRVLISAESDGIDADGNSVEIKANKYPYYDRIACQMISSGSQTLYMGHKSKDGKRLERVSTMTLDQVLVKGMEKHGPKLTRNLKRSMAALQHARDTGTFKSGCPFQLQFSNRTGELIFHPVSLLPNKDVVKALLKAL